MLSYRTCALLFLASIAWAGPPMSSGTDDVVRSAVSAGGGGRSVSGANALDPIFGEEVVSATAPFSGANRLGAGYMHIYAFPGRVGDLAARPDVSVSSASLVWSSPGYDGGLGALQSGSTYFIRVASFTAPDTFSDHRLANISFSTSGVAPGAAVSTGAAGLLPNTTYWARLWAVDAAGDLSYASNISTFVTLALPAALQPESFVQVYFTSCTVHWVARPSLSQDVSSMSAAGYLVEASSTNFGALAPDSVISSSQTDAVTLSTLTVSDPGLIVDRDYYFRVGTLNWAGIPNWTVLGSTKTRFQVNDPIASDPLYTDVSTGALSVHWDRNGNPANAQYHAEVSSNASFAGLVTTTDTYSLFYSTGGLLFNTTYFFRVYATTRSVSSGWAYLPSTATWAQPPAAAAFPLVEVSSRALTVRWLHNGNPPSVSTYGVVATTEAFYPNDATENVVLPSTRPAGSDPMATLTELRQNTTYFLFADARNWSNASNGFVLLGSTATRPGPPSAVGFEEVDFSSAVVSWSINGNPVGITTYTVVLSTMSVYPPAGAWDVWASTVPDSLDAVILPMAGLQLNATYHLFVDAVGHAHESLSVGPSSATQASPPGPSPDAADFAPVSATAFTLNWSSGSADPGFNAAAPLTTYYALVSANPGFSPVLSSSRTFNLDASFSGLSVNTTYYAKVAAYSHHSGTWTVYADFGSSATLAAVPVAGAPTFVAVYFDSATVSWGRNGSPVDITSYTVVLSSGDAYPNDLLDNVVLDTAPAGANPTATLTGLSSGTTYYLSVRALNHRGASTAYAALGSTRTMTAPKTWIGGGGNTNWYNAANWSPSGVPSRTDSVTIPLSVSVIVNASSPSISFSSLTLGVPAGTAVANLFLSTAIKSGGDVLIYKGAGLTQNSTQQLRITGDWTMMSGSSLTHVAHASATLTSEVWIDVSGTFDLQAGSSITVSSQGYAGGAANGGDGFGPGPGLGDSATSGGGSGAGHGATGGVGGTSTGGAAYDSFTDPVDAGSGGGGGDFASGTNVGGAGGGVVRLSAGTLLLNGRVDVLGATGGPGSGTAARAAGGGGSGGTVNLKAGTFSGSGRIFALGGRGGTDANAGIEPGGGGAGGRVALSISVSGNACSVAVSTAAGGSGGGSSGPGGDGTFSSTSTLIAPSGFAATAISSSSVSWTWGLSPYGVNYQVFDAGDSPVSSLLGSAVTQFDENGLLPNTTYSRYVRVTACGAGTSTLPTIATTLTSTPTLVAAPFPEVWTASITASWAAFAPGGSQGYLLEASSTNFSALSPGGITHSSQTYSVLQSTLAAFSPPLLANTSYYFRVAGLNWSGALGPYSVMGATPTLAEAPSPGLLQFLSIQVGTASVNVGTVTVAWAALPASPPHQTCEGYVLRASSDDFSVGGTAPVFSSTTYSVLASTLTLGADSTPLDLSNTYYFQVGSLNHAGRPNYAQLARLNFQIELSTDHFHVGAIDPTVSRSAVSLSSMVVRNVGNWPVTIELQASTATVGGSPWALSTVTGNETATLKALWNATSPAPASFVTYLTTTTRISQSAGNYAGGQNGYQIPAGGSSTLWFYVTVPDSSGSIGPETIRVTPLPVYP